MLGTSGEDATILTLCTKMLILEIEFETPFNDMFYHQYGQNYNVVGILGVVHKRTFHVLIHKRKDALVFL